MTDRHQTCMCHADSCRRCGAVLARALLHPARTVLNNPKARGWFCGHCSDIARVR